MTKPEVSIHGYRGVVPPRYLNHFQEGNMLHPHGQAHLSGVSRGNLHVPTRTLKALSSPEDQEEEGNKKRKLPYEPTQAGRRNSQHTWVKCK